MAEHPHRRSLDLAGEWDWTPTFQRWPQWQQPALASGEHRLELVLLERTGAVRSGNGYAMTMVHRGLDLPPPG